MKILLLLQTALFILLFSTSSFGQDTLLSGIPPIAFGSAATLASPNNINAEDGKSSLRIVVSWDAVPNAKWYIVYRDSNSSGRNKRALLNRDGTIKEYRTPGMYDASEELIAGVLYYYWIAAVEVPDEVNLDIQEFDPGHLAVMASDDTPNPVTENDYSTLGTLRSEVLIEEIELTNTSITDRKFFSNIELQNNGNTIGENIQLSYYLSQDENLDRRDKKLYTYNLEDIEANTNYQATLVTPLSSTIVSGSYYLIVSIQEGDFIGNTVIVPIILE